MERRNQKIDAERVFAYRALTFSRFDQAELPGFDENRWAANADTKHRKWSDLKKEFANVRGSTKLLFESFTEKQWLATGTASGHPVNCVALAFICCGHVEHHINIIKEKYL